MGKMLPGHDDLRPRSVIGIDSNGKLLVDYGNDGIRRFGLELGPSGNLTAVPYVDPAKDDLPDQVGGTPRKSATLAQRLKDVDQG